MVLKKSKIFEMFSNCIGNCNTTHACPTGETDCMSYYMAASKCRSACSDDSSTHSHSSTESDKKTTNKNKNKSDKKKAAKKKAAKKKAAKKKAAKKKAAKKKAAKNKAAKKKAAEKKNVCDKKCVRKIKNCLKKKFIKTINCDASDEDIYDTCPIAKRVKNEKRKNNIYNWFVKKCNNKKKTKKKK